MGLSDIFAPKILKRIINIENNGLATPICECVEDIEPFTPLAITAEGKVQNPFIVEGNVFTAESVLNVYGDDDEEHKYLDIIKVSSTRIIRTYVSSGNTKEVYVELVNLNPVTKTIDVESSLLVTVPARVDNMTTTYDSLTNRLAILTGNSYNSNYITGVQITGGILSLIAISTVIGTYYLTGYKGTLAFKDGVGVAIDNCRKNKYVKFEITATEVNFTKIDESLPTTYFTTPAFMYEEDGIVKVYTRYHYMEFTLDSSNYQNSTLTVAPLGGVSLYNYRTILKHGDSIYGLGYMSDNQLLEAIRIDKAYPTSVVQISPIAIGDSQFYLGQDQAPFLRNMSLSHEGKHCIVGTQPYNTQKRHRVYEVTPATNKESLILLPVDIYPTESVDSSYVRDDTFFGMYDDTSDTLMFYNTSSTTTQYCDFVTAQENISATGVDAFVTQSYTAGEKATLMSSSPMYQTKNISAGTVTPNGWIIAENGVGIPTK